ncbi:MAG TPA: methyltransferase domain-containing protein [Chloroflexi bacterium]|nr:methyltransferase domain-containing protein [Chloroflexota bacterium]
MDVRNSTRKIEFGDFQTPTDLANRICDMLSGKGLRPYSIVEPTCGEGNLLLAALERFPSAARVIGVDISHEHIERAQKRLTTRSYADKTQLFQGDFFEIKWGEILDGLPDPVLVIGNPPWVTSAELARLNSTNLPNRSNFHGLSGLDARTGKSNFDISEWMLIHILDLLSGRDATMAMLCKTRVARQVLVYAWKRKLPLGFSRMYLIDAAEVFDASVDACLLVCGATESKGEGQICQVYQGISGGRYQTTFGYRDARLVADMDCYERWKHLEDVNPYRWRSGIKHDCASVMELAREEGGFRNKFGELYDLETRYMYPMLKSSDVANESAPLPSRWMLVTQTFIGKDTTCIKSIAPKTWDYLMGHSDLFDKRQSSVYKGKPPFSIFGVGEYSFAPWKVAISGLYKRLHFAIVGPFAGKPVVLDDTCYFLPCQSEDEARYLAGLLNSTAAAEFFRAFIFWDAKRPITVGVLNRLSLLALARELDSEDVLLKFLSASGSGVPPRQLALFEMQEGHIYEFRR